MYNNNRSYKSVRTSHNADTKSAGKLTCLKKHEKATIALTTDFGELIQQTRPISMSDQTRDIQN